MAFRITRSTSYLISFLLSPGYDIKIWEHVGTIIELLFIWYGVAFPQCTYLVDAFLRRDPFYFYNFISDTTLFKDF